MKEKKSSIKAFILVAILLVISLLWDKGVFELVYNSDLPNWLKYILLRG